MLDLTANPRATASLDVLDPATGERGGPHPGRFAGGRRRRRARRPRRPARLGAHRARRARRAPSRPPPGACAPHAEELAELATREGGKPLADSLGGVEAGHRRDRAVRRARARCTAGRSLQGGWDAADLMVHEPRGVVALLVPWNDPIAIACGQIAAALVTGNAVVYKPSEKTPLSGARLVELLDLPATSSSSLHGDARAGRPLAAHPRVDLVHPHGLGPDGPRGGGGVRRPPRQGAAASWAARTR